MVFRSPQHSPLLFLSVLAVVTIALLSWQPAQAANIYGLSHYGLQTVSERLQALENSVDTNSDKEVTAKEVAIWVRNLVQEDKNNNCVTQDQWVAGMQERARFTQAFAKYYNDFLEQQPGWNEGGCSNALNTKVLEDSATNSSSTSSDTGSGTSSGSDTSSGTGTSSGIDSGKASYPQSLDDFIDGFITKLTEFCESGSSGSSGLYSDNDDCSTLPTACASEPFGCEHTCREYTFVTTAGRTYGAFSTRALQHATASASGLAPVGFAAKLKAMFNDLNDDGIFSQQEQAKDYKENFDNNRDDCVDRAEFLARMSTAICHGFDFSEQFAQARFDALTAKSTSSNCTGIDVSSMANMTKSAFMEANTATLVSLCEDKDKKSKVPECSGISRICEVDKETSSTSACKQYVEETKKQDNLPVQDTAVKFYNFVKQWGSFEDYFGKDRRVG